MMLCLLSALLLSASSDALQAPSRRSFVGGAVSSFVVGIGPSVASARIDVSNLPVAGGASSGNSVLKEQLKAFDGSGSARVEEIKAAAVSSRPSPVSAMATPEAPSNAATFALRYGSYTKLTKLGFGDRYRYEDYVLGPASSKVAVSFDFPSDWLQLDRMSGGVQYVDQRNGDKVYLLRMTLPEGNTLETAPKSIFGDYIFNPEGSISKSGTTIEDYKVSRSEPLEEGRRRLTMKYATVTGNGLRVERRALVDAYQVKSDSVYMLMTSSNAAKFEAKGRERDTVEAMVNSFRCESF